MEPDNDIVVEELSGGDAYAISALEAVGARERTAAGTSKQRPPPVDLRPGGFERSLRALRDTDVANQSAGPAAGVVRERV